MKAEQKNWGIGRRQAFGKCVGAVFLLAGILCPSSVILAAASAASPPPDIRDIVAPQPFHISGNYWLLLVAAGCSLAAALVGWLLWRRLRRPKVVVLPTPHEIAYERLSNLRARADALDPRAFGEEAADTLRAFIGAQYRLQAQRQTSPEFLESMRGSTLFSTTQHTVLADFLTRCDLLKFARQNATRDGKLKLLDQATLFLDTDPKLPPLPAPQPRPPSAAPPSEPPPLPGAGDRYPYDSPDSRYMPPA